MILAWLGVFTPLSGLHKFYLGQHGWGIVYLLLQITQIPRVACAVEGVMLLRQSPDEFERRWRDGVGTVDAPVVSLDPTQINALGAALRELDSLRQEGLISELEFEQKRRRLLDQVA
ncbi:MAG TPA: hypothetical protein VLS96_04530 [Nodosilinea sp.]|nr:hypothetical protein [Nodosilinea sp.]